MKIRILEVLFYQNKCEKFKAFLAFFNQLTCIRYFNFFLQTLLFYYRSESESEVEKVIPLLSEEDMNKLGAKLVKAEIMGNTVRLSSMCIITCINTCSLKSKNVVQYNCSLFKHDVTSPIDIYSSY